MTRAPRAPRDPVKRPRAIRREDRASSRGFQLLLDALEGCTGPNGACSLELARTPDLHVAFLLDNGETLGCVRIRRGRLSREPHTTSADAPADTRVVLSPGAAKQVLTGHPASALGNAYFNGQARVEGDVRHLMNLLNLLECLAPHLDSDGGKR